MLTNPAASYIIPFRHQDSIRLENLVAVLDWIQDLPDIEIIIVEQDSTSKLSDLTIQQNTKVQFVTNAGAFNKSWAFNIGARIARSGVLILADADMVIDLTTLQQCIAVCATETEAVNPYDQLIDLSGSQRQNFIEQGNLPYDSLEEKKNREGIGEYICFCGGMFLIRKDKYLEIGGMDESFEGWGGEDDAMSIRMVKSGVTRLVRQHQSGFHLWHPRPKKDRYGHQKYLDNIALLRQYQTMTPLEVDRLNKISAATIGNLAKYQA